MEYKVIERYGKYYYQDKEGRIYGGGGLDAAGEFVDGKAWYMLKKQDFDYKTGAYKTKEEYYVVDEGFRSVMSGEEAKEYAEQRRTQPTWTKSNWKKKFKKDGDEETAYYCLTTKSGKEVEFPVGVCFVDVKEGLTVLADKHSYFFVNEKGEELFDERFAYAGIAKSGVLTVGRKQDDKTLAYAISKEGEIIAGPYSSLSMADRKGAIKKEADNNSKDAEYIEFAVDEKGRCDDYKVALELVKRDIRFLFQLSDRVYLKCVVDSNCSFYLLEAAKKSAKKALLTSEQKSIGEKFKEGLKAIPGKLKKGAAPKKASVAEAAEVTKAIEQFKETGDPRKIIEMFEKREEEAIDKYNAFRKQLEEGEEYLKQKKAALEKERQEQADKQKQERKKQEEKDRKFNEAWDAAWDAAREKNRDRFNKD